MQEGWLVERQNGGGAVAPEVQRGCLPWGGSMEIGFLAGAAMLAVSALRARVMGHYSDG